MDFRVSVDSIFDAFGGEATVTRPNTDPIETTVVFVPSLGSGDNQFAHADIDNHGVEIMRAARRRVMAFRVDELPAAPVGTLIVAAEAFGDDAQQWVVDEIGYVENDLLRVLVRPMTSDEHLANWGKG